MTKNKINNRRVAGCDEVGSGAFFGPVGAGAVIISPCMEHLFVGANVRDSKKVTSIEKRELLAEFIRNNAIAWGVGFASVQEIDELKINHATFLAMRRAIANMGVKPDMILVDGKYEIPGIEIPQIAIKGGDATEMPISAASIVAKVARDRIIIELDKKYPGYGLAQHKGYGTPQHIEALKRLGMTPAHRPGHCHNTTTEYARR